MYTLMNKDTPLIDFHWELQQSGESKAVTDKVYSKPWFIYNLDTWLTARGVARHRRHMLEMLATLGLQTTKDIMDVSLGLSVTDTLWVNIDDKFNWNGVNLFTNEFNQTIELLAFGSNAEVGELRETSPEFGTNGAFAKCWHREHNGQIYLYKQGSSGGTETGNEIYSELYASQLLSRLGYAHVDYDIIEYHGKLASRCRLFTSEKEMLLPAGCLKSRNLKTLEQLEECCKRLGASKELAEHILLDALILNEDRHLGNFGILCDADTFEIKGLSPTFDNGMSLLCYYAGWRDKPRMEDPEFLKYVDGKRASLYTNFATTAARLGTSEQINALRGIESFEFRNTGEFNLPQERLELLSKVVQRQAMKIQQVAEAQAEETTLFV